MKEIRKIIDDELEEVSGGRVPLVADILDAKGERIIESLKAEGYTKERVLAELKNFEMPSPNANLLRPRKGLGFVGGLLKDLRPKNEDNVVASLSDYINEKWDI